MSKYFSESEMKCKCGKCEGLPAQGIDERLYWVLDSIRETLGEAVYVNCAYRCPEHNAEVGGVPNSQHIQGVAADITAETASVETVAQIAEKVLEVLEIAGGVGRYPSQNFVHVDTLETPANRRWDENDY